MPNKTSMSLKIIFIDKACACWAFQRNVMGINLIELLKSFYLLGQIFPAKSLTVKMLFCFSQLLWAHPLQTMWCDWGLHCTTSSWIAQEIVQATLKKAFAHPGPLGKVYSQEKKKGTLKSKLWTSAWKPCAHQAASISWAAVCGLHCSWMIIWKWDEVFFYVFY